MLKIKRPVSFSKVNELAMPNSISPFQSFEFPEAFAKNFCAPKEIYLLSFYDQDKLVGFGAFEKINKKLVFLGMKPVLGKYKIMDYGDIIDKAKSKKIWPLILDFFQKEGIFEIVLDHVREDSQTLSFFRENSELKPIIIVQDVSPFLKLPISWDDYLTGLSRTDRKELKRKIRRLKENYSYKIESVADITRTDFNDFVGLHRLSTTQKAIFMSPQMADFFWDLTKVQKGNWRTLIYFLKLGHKRVASVFAFENSKQLLCYNSGFNPKFSFFSVGLILKALLIKIAIEKKLEMVDFLRGDERYKYDLGGQNLNLYQIKLSL